MKAVATSIVVAALIIGGVLIYLGTRPKTHCYQSKSLYTPGLVCVKK